MPKGLWGAEDATFSRFKGVVEDCDPTEIGDERAAAASNVDMEGECVRRRLGRSRFSDALVPDALRITGLHAHYPAGGDRVLLSADDTLVRFDYGGGLVATFGTLAGNPVDFAPYQERVYIGSGGVDLQVWTMNGIMEPVAAPAAPTLDPPVLTVVKAMDMETAGDWSSTHADLTANDYVTLGETRMRLNAASSSAIRQWIEAPWSAGATLDLSLNDRLEFEAVSHYAGIQFQLGVKNNAGVIQWLETIYTVAVADVRATYSASLKDIDPADRNASTGVAIAFHAPLSGAGYPQDIVFSPIYVVVPFEADTYRYYATTYDDSALALGKPPESAVSAVSEIALPPDHHAASIDVNVPYSLSPTVSHIRIYRRRVDAPYAKPRLVVELPNDGMLATYSDRRPDSALELEDAAEWTTQYLIAPPQGTSFAMVRNRLLIGNGQRVYLSEYQKPYLFASAQDATDPLSAGYVDLSEPDEIVRIVDVDGNAVIFCERSIWTLEGTGWDDFALRKRASVGLDARWAVAVYGRLLLFLAGDGVRALALTFGSNEQFSTWPISEPVAARLRAIPTAYRANAAFGIDERERLHVSYTPSGGTVNSAAVILDLRQPGALTNKPDPLRPGWTAYDGWGFSLFHSLKRGGGDNGQMLGGSPLDDIVWWCQRDGADAAILADDGAAIAWSWTGPCLDVGRGKKSPLVYVAAEFDAAAGQSVTLKALLDRGASEQTATRSLGAATTGIVPVERRIAGEARYVQLEVSGENSVAMTMRSGGLGFYSPRVR